MWLLLHTVQSDKNEHPTNIFTGGASSYITNPWMDNSEGSDVMLHHLVNLATVCTTHFDCTTKMARTSQPDFLQTESRADDKGEASGKARGGGSRVAGELAAAAADSDQAARQLHWPAAHTRIPSTPPRISAARPSCEHMPWHRAATPGTGIHHSCINPVFSGAGPGKISLLAGLWAGDPRVRHNGTSVDTTPGPREGKVEGRGRPLREGAIQGSAPFRRRPRESTQGFSIL